MLLGIITTQFQAVARVMMPSFVNCEKCGLAQKSEISKNF
jgi:hypothetical protein